MNEHITINHPKRPGASGTSSSTYRIIDSRHSDAQNRKVIEDAISQLNDMLAQFAPPDPIKFDKRDLEIPGVVNKYTSMYYKPSTFAIEQFRLYDRDGDVAKSGSPFVDAVKYIRSQTGLCLMSSKDIVKSVRDLSHIRSDQIVPAAIAVCNHIYHIHGHLTDNMLSLSDIQCHINAIDLLHCPRVKYSKI